MSKSLRLTLDMEIHAVTCPGVWFSHKGPIYLSVCFLGFHVRTKPFPPTFPLLFGDKFIFEKTFPGVSSLQGLEEVLKRQPLYLELLQEIHSIHESDIVLASFETSGFELLFPYPQLRPSYNSGIDVDLLLVPTSDFPGTISPKVEVSTRCNINETRHPVLDQHHDNAVTINQIPPMNTHPHIPPRSSSRCRSRERDPFVVRRVDEDLIGRKPTQTPPPPVRKNIHRSKSLLTGLNYASEEPLPGYKPREEASSHCHRHAHEPPPRPFTPPPPNMRRGRSKTRRSAESRHGSPAHRPNRAFTPSVSPHRRHIYFTEEEGMNRAEAQSREEEEVLSPAYSQYDDQRMASSQRDAEEDACHCSHHHCHHVRHRHIRPGSCSNIKHYPRHSAGCSSARCAYVDCCCPCAEEILISTPHIHSSRSTHPCCSAHCCTHFSY